jgi:hypothetical protein
MKKLFSIAVVILFILSGLQSCTTQRDCQGVKHTKLPNGVRI